MDTVSRYYVGIEDGVDPKEQDEAWSTLEAHLALAALTPGTVAELLLRVSPPPPSTEPLPTQLRAVAWLRLGAPLDQTWSRGPDSAAMWSLLLAPAPVDRHDEWVLATTHRLPPDSLGGLTLGRTPLPAHARVKSARAAKARH